MRFHNKIVAHIAAASLLGTAILGGSGCDRGSDAPAPSGSTAPAPTSTPPKPQAGVPTAGVKPVRVAAATIQPSFLYIKYLDESAAATVDVPAAGDFGTARQFPPARMRVIGKGDEPVTALLFSDDPKEAFDKNWAGDRYYFSMNLQQTTDPRHLDGAQWYFSASPTQSDETGNGIFLHGDQLHLEPVQAMIQLEGDAPHLIIHVSGDFIQVDAEDPTGKPKRCRVTGILAPVVELKD